MAAERACWKLPSGVRTACTTCPEPPQVPHVAGVDPALTPLPVQVEQASRRLTSTALLWHARHMQCQSECAEVSRAASNALPRQHLIPNFCLPPAQYWVRFACFISSVPNACAE